MNTQMQKELERLEFAVADGDLNEIAQAMADFRSAMKSEVTDVNQMLAGRESRYGSFQNHASISQALKSVMQARSGWDRLAADQKEALEMVQHKVARILNGDPNWHDSWLDVAGYATLVANRLEKEENRA